MSNLKPFNLERALAGDPVITRDGRPVCDVAYMPHGDESQKVACIINNPEGRPALYAHYLSGKFLSTQTDKSDLFMAPVEKEYWIATGINIEGTQLYTSMPHESIESAKRWASEVSSLRDYQFHKIMRLE